MRSKLGITRAVAACSLSWASPNLRRAQLAFGAIWASEWAATVALAVVAFADGGAAAVGMVGLLRMLPAALLAPVAATIADRVRREKILASIGLARAAALGLAGALVFADGWIPLVYAALVAATVTQTLYRPAHSALLPSLCATPDELTNANTARGLLDSVATLLGPLAAAVIMTVSGTGAVFVAAAGASLWSAAIVLGVRYEAPPRIAAPRSARRSHQTVDGFRAIAADRGLTVLTALTTLQTFTRGALSVFVVVVAIELIGTSEAGVGVLTAAVGAGAVAGSLGMTLLGVRGRLARCVGIGVALWGAPLAAIGAIPEQWAALSLLALIGIGNALVDVGAFTLPARLVDDALLARTFAAFEAILTLGVGAGAILTPLVIDALGTRWALAAIGLAGPLAVLAAWPALRALDARVRVRDGDIALLQGVAMLSPLPQATIEQLASRLQRQTFPAGSLVITQGEHGDAYYLIEHGQATVLGDGHSIGGLGPGDGFGEIALIRSCRRTRSVLAVTPLRVCTLRRSSFLAAVNGYSTSAIAADATVNQHLAGFRTSDHDHPHARPLRPSPDESRPGADTSRRLLAPSWPSRSGWHLASGPAPDGPTPEPGDPTSQRARTEMAGRPILRHRFRVTDGEQPPLSRHALLSVWLPRSRKPTSDG